MRSKRGLGILIIGLALLGGILTEPPVANIFFGIALAVGALLLLALSLRITQLHDRVSGIRVGQSTHAQQGAQRFVDDSFADEAITDDSARASEPATRPPSSAGADNLGYGQGEMESARRLLPDDNLLNRVLAARLEEQVGSPESALPAWREVLVVAPANEEGVCGVARNLEKLARFTEAMKILESGPAGARESPDGLLAAGRCLEKMGRFDDAIECWSRFLEARPDSRTARRSLAAVKARKASGVAGRELDLSNERDAAKVAETRLAIESAAAAVGGSKPDEEYLRRHSYMRYNRSIGNLLPWIGQHIDLRTSEVIEVGCGTGSTLVGLAMNSRHAHGYDIDKQVLETCAARARAFGLDNLSLHLCSPETLQAEMAERHGAAGVDAILLYAVLEHLTPTERLEALTNTWALLRPEGLLIVVEAPNRFTYFDWHSTQLPFFHQLPLELQRLYFDRSPRPAYVESMQRALAAEGTGGLDEALTRFGQSLSYHEFELALGPIDEFVIDDGNHPLVDRVFTGNELIGEESLKAFLETWNVTIPRGFARANINVILRKPTATI